MAKRKKGVKGLMGLGGEEEEDLFGCDYHIDQSGSKKRLVLECTDCNKAPSLNDQECLTSVLEIMADEMGVDTLVLSHYEDTEYFGPSMDVLRNLVDFMDSIEDFTMRDPVERYFDYLSDKDKKKLKCHGCTFNPSNVFSRLYNKFSQGIEKYEMEFNRIIREIDRSQNTHSECEECTYSTLEDLDYLKKEYEKLYKMTMREIGEEAATER